MAEETRQENAVRSGDDVTCPNCGSHNVRCIPYPYEKILAESLSH